MEQRTEKTDLLSTKYFYYSKTFQNIYLEELCKSNFVVWEILLSIRSIMYKWHKPKAFQILFIHLVLNKRWAHKYLSPHPPTKVKYSFNFFLFLSLFIFTLQYCIGFVKHQHASVTGVHVFPILNPPSNLPPHTIPLGHPTASVPSFLYPASNLDWWFVSYMILYMF